jgi:hypothetical protein
VAIDFNDYKCQFCGRTCTNFVFAAFVCDDAGCIEKAREERGGPAGHMKRKERGEPIIPIDPVKK